MQSRFRQTTIIPHIRTAALCALACAATAAAVIWVLSLIAPERPLWVDLTAVALISAAATFPLQLMLGQRNEAVRHMRNELEHARQYPVTDMPQSVEFAPSVEHAIDRRHTSAAENSDGIMLVLQVDNFHEVGQRYGSQWADTLLQSIIQIVYASVRYGDLVARLAADQLGIYLPGATPENANDICERIRTRIRETTFAAGQERQIVVSVRLGGTRIGHQADFQVIRDAAALAEEETGSTLFRERFS